MIALCEIKAQSPYPNPARGIVRKPGWGNGRAPVGDSPGDVELRRVRLKLLCVQSCRPKLVCVQSCCALKICMRPKLSDVQSWCASNVVGVGYEPRALKPSAATSALSTLYRGTSLIRNSPPLGPYGSPALGPYGFPRGVGVSFERGTPVSYRLRARRQQPKKKT